MSGLMAACWMPSPGAPLHAAPVPEAVRAKSHCRVPGTTEAFVGPLLTGRPDDLRRETELIICNMLLPSLRIPLLAKHTASSPSHE